MAWSGSLLLRLCSKKRNCTQFSGIHSSAAERATSSSFTWNDVWDAVPRLPRFPRSKSKFSPTNLQGYLDKIKICNRASKNECDFIPFKIENHVAGYVHNGFADKLREFNEVFSFPNNSEILLHSALKTPEDRTIAVGAVIKSIRDIISPGIQNESDDEADYDQLHPVMSSFDSEPFFSIECAAVPYFGIKTYGVHMNGYVEYDGEKYMWIGKRSESEPTYPGMLEILVAGELPQGTSCQDHLVKLCEEEAGIMSSIASQAIPVGVVSYRDIEGYRCKRDIMFCYDLRLSPRFVPKNQDGEVRSVRIVPAPLVENIIQRTEFFKPDCNLLIIDFLCRHGFMNPEDVGYLELVRSLRDVTCFE